MTKTSWLLAAALVASAGACSAPGGNSDAGGCMPANAGGGGGGDDADSLDAVSTTTDPCPPPSGHDSGMPSDSAPADPCGGATRCESCAATSGCGWCATSGACLHGRSSGPDNGACAGADWRWTTGQCSGGGTDASMPACIPLRGSCTGLDTCCAIDTPAGMQNIGCSSGEPGGAICCQIAGGFCNSTDDCCSGLSCQNSSGQMRCLP